MASSSIDDTLCGIAVPLNFDTSLVFAFCAGGAKLVFDLGRSSRMEAGYQQGLHGLIARNGCGATGLTFEGIGT